MRDIYVWRPRKWTRTFTLGDDTPPDSLYTLDPSTVDERYEWVDVAGAAKPTMRCHALTIAHASRCPKDGVILIRMAVAGGNIVPITVCGGHFGMLGRGKALLVTQAHMPARHSVDRAHLG